VLCVFKAEEWRTSVSRGRFSLIYSMIDVLLAVAAARPRCASEGRPYTTIETQPRQALVECDGRCRAGFGRCRRDLLDRPAGNNPRFPAISRPANAATLVRLHIDMEDPAAISSCCCPMPPSSRSARC